MCDYSVYYKQPTAPFSIDNPKPRPKIKTSLNEKMCKQQPIENEICFKIIVLQRSLKIVINKESSLEDLYIKIYNAVYPEFSTEKHVDNIPPPDISMSGDYFPMIYFVSVFTKNEDVVPVPYHRLITISMFMKAKPDCFTNIAMFGMPIYKIYTLDEESYHKLIHKTNTRKNYMERYLACLL